MHRGVGPGLLEPVYAACLGLELNRAGIAFGRQLAVPVIDKGIPIGLGFRAEVVVEDAVIVEVKQVPAHEAPPSVKNRFGCTKTQTRWRRKKLAVGSLDAAPPRLALSIYSNSSEPPARR
ncbi:GxxExxY protein [Rhodopila sp.]|uniref:GxxExxY protein n=1 Tax=Rhodopila sp. TaxID=2480087 RepID=UPI003D0A8ABA